TRYFRDVCQYDRRFTARTYHYEETLPPEVRDALNRHWPRPRAGSLARFDAGLHSAIPLCNTLWPANRFMLHRDLLIAMQDNRVLHARLVGPPVRFGRALAEAENHTPPAAGFRPTWKRWGYNDFLFELDAERPGWVYVRQTHDPNWRATLDGRPVAIVRAGGGLGMAVQLPSGTHTLELDY